MTQQSVALNFRIKPSVRNVIDRAAELTGKNRTDFMVEASEQRAEEVLADHNQFVVDPDMYAAFLARLDAPVQPNANLRKTMKTPSPWGEK